MLLISNKERHPMTVIPDFFHNLHLLLILTLSIVIFYKYLSIPFWFSLHFSSWFIIL